WSLPLSPLIASIIFNDTPTNGIYTLSLHDALPISVSAIPSLSTAWGVGTSWMPKRRPSSMAIGAISLTVIDTLSPGMTISLSLRSEEHTSELQSRSDLVCRLLLEKKNNFVYCATYH